GPSAAPLSADAGESGSDGGAPEAISAAGGRRAPTEAKGDHCPAGMILVEGEYCTDVDYTCKKQWYDKSNKKEICEEFEPKSTCVGKKVKKRFCIDEFTWPNEKGARPEVMNRFHQAQVKCAAVGKRMCTESEWTLSCEGPRMLPFPYGYVRDTKKCHGDLEWDSPDMKKVAARDPDELARLWKGVRNGSQPECTSEYGVQDLPGNVDEVVASEHFDDPSFKGKYDSIHTGGPWYKGVRNQCRPKIYTHDEGFYYYFLGFRCCAEPDGKPTEPLTAKQVKDKWKWSRVEKVAGFTVEQMKEKLTLKQKNQCTCAAQDILCKTMCGTLLGPSAKDFK
ncbi:MAG TPA: SUMF1/EgtB/PvdO family nonheme iron enzyme, partial [Polyangiaceae bacterium]|nr:SUMF1/EgtB/PvdO family nonheme iron enzyme [Polyangiaceae bacterium]